MREFVVTLPTGKEVTVKARCNCVQEGFLILNDFDDIGETIRVAVFKEWSHFIDTREEVKREA